MPALRSRTVTHGRNMAGARALWRATGMTDSDFGKPIVAIANSFTQFVPGHVHLRDMGKLVSSAIVEAGGVGKEFNTIAVDDGIAMGHGGMLYSLPSRELIADSVEYMVNAHCADALVCISNCDKITPGMLLAALRLNIPTVFVSGGPMEAGRVDLPRLGKTGLDLVNAMTASADPAVSDEELTAIEQEACPTCGSCSGMFTANSMNCLLEALGLALPGNGSTLATASARRDLFLNAGRLVVELAKRWYDEDDASVLPLSIATKPAFANAMRLDVAMGGSTNTVLHILAAAREAGVDFTQDDIDQISRHTPCVCKVAPNSPKYYMEDVHRAGGIAAILGELHRGGLLDTSVHAVHSPDIDTWLDTWDIRSGKASETAIELFHAAPGGVRTTEAFSSTNRWETLDVDSEGGCIRDVEHPYTVDGGLAILKGNLAPDGCIVKTAGVPETHLELPRPCPGLRVAGGRRRGDPRQAHRRRRHRRDPLRGPQGRPRHAGDALPDLVPEGPRARPEVRADHRRPLLRRHLRAVDRARVARGSSRRHHRAGRGRRHHRDLHPEPVDQPGRRRPDPAGPSRVPGRCRLGAGEP